MGFAALYPSYVLCHKPQNKTGAILRPRRLKPSENFCSVNQTRARRLFKCCSERAVFLACGAGEGSDPVQVVLRLFAVALFDLPQAVILPGLDVVRIGLERALVPDLRHLVVAELAIGVAD